MPYYDRILIPMEMVPEIPQVTYEFLREPDDSLRQFLFYLLVIISDPQEVMDRIIRTVHEYDYLNPSPDDPLGYTADNAINDIYHHYQLLESKMEPWLGFLKTMPHGTEVKDIEINQHDERTLLLSLTYGEVFQPKFIYN